VRYHDYASLSVMMKSMQLIVQSRPCTARAALSMEKTLGGTRPGDCRVQIREVGSLEDDMAAGPTNRISENDDVEAKGLQHLVRIVHYWGGNA
jgi:hypothetical protein